MNKHKMRTVTLLLAITLLSMPSCGNNANAITEVDSEPTHENGTFISPDQSAQLIVTDKLKQLKLSGTNEICSYNYGYLLADYIIETIDTYVFWYMDENSISYDSLSAIQQYIVWEEDVETEYSQIIKGIEDKLLPSERMVNPPNEAPHMIGVTDLKILNSLPDWADIFGCSSFSAWGKNRRDGTLILGRNLDYFLDPSENVKNLQLIVSYDIPGKKRWVNTTVIGYTGCLSGINEDSVAIVMQNSNGSTPTQSSGFYTRGATLRYIMESGVSSPSEADSILDTRPVYVGNNFHIVFPTNGRVDSTIAAVLEYDGVDYEDQGFCTVRTVNQNGITGIENNQFLIDMNHYLLRKDESKGSESSIRRYNTIKESLVNMGYTKTESDIQYTEILLESVGGYGTLHSVIFQPDSMMLDIYIGEPTRGAFEASPYSYKFEDLF